MKDLLSGDFSNSAMISMIYLIALVIFFLILVILTISLIAGKSRDEDYDDDYLLDEGEEDEVEMKPSKKSSKKQKKAEDEDIFAEAFSESTNESMKNFDTEDSAFNDGASAEDSAYNDSAFNDSAFNDSAFSDSAFAEDSAFSDSAFSDSAFNDSAFAEDSAFINTLDDEPASLDDSYVNTFDEQSELSKQVNAALANMADNLTEENSNEESGESFEEDSSFADTDELPTLDPNMIDNTAMEQEEDVDVQAEGYVDSAFGPEAVNAEEKQMEDAEVSSDHVAENSVAENNVDETMASDAAVAGAVASGVIASEVMASSAVAAEVATSALATANMANPTGIISKKSGKKTHNKVVLATTDFYWFNKQEVAQKPSYKTVEMYHHSFNMASECIDDMLMEMYDCAFVRTEEIRYLAYGINPRKVSFNDLCTLSMDGVIRKYKTKNPEPSDLKAVYEKWCDYVDDFMDAIEVHADQYTYDEIYKALYEFGKSDIDVLLEGQ